MKNEMRIFEGTQVHIIEKDGEPMFEVYSTGMALGQVKFNSVGTAYPRKDRIDENLKNAEIIPCVRNGHSYITEEQLYDLMLEMKTDKVKPFRKWVISEILPAIRKTFTELEKISFKGNIDGIVYSKNGIPITTSRIISEITNKSHNHILRDIREEISKLNEIDSPNLDSDIKEIINDFKEVEYIATNGQVYKEYELGEMATMQLMLKYSTEYRAKFIICFSKMKKSIMNMFKAKVIESVLPQDNRDRQYIYI